MYTYDFWGGRVTSHYNGCSIFCRSEKTFKMWFIIDLSGKETISEFNILYRIILERGEHFFFYYYYYLHFVYMHSNTDTQIVHIIYMRTIH